MNHNDTLHTLTPNALPPRPDNARKRGRHGLAHHHAHPHAHPHAHQHAHPAAHAGAPAHEQAEDALLASLGRRFSGATLRLSLELRTATARQLFQRDFVYVSQQLHALEASRRVQGLDRQLLKSALAVIEHRAGAVRTALLLIASQARALVATHGHEAADIAFTRAIRLEATIVSPYARRFLELLSLADEALGECERAWLLGLLEPAAKARCIAECRKALHGFKETVREQRHTVGKRVREVNATRRHPSPSPVCEEAVATVTPDDPAQAADECGTRPPSPAEPAMPPAAFSISSFQDLPKLGLHGADPQPETPPETRQA